MSVWGALMVIAGGLFAGGAATFAWSRAPIWRRMPASTFVDDFSQTISRTDKVQPALLVVAIAGSLGFALTQDGAQRVLALAGGVGFVLVLVASLLVMVPLQRRLIEGADRESVADMRQRWFEGNLGRSVLSVVAFVLTGLALGAG